MKKSKGSPARARLILTEIEKLDGSCSGLAFFVKGWLDKGVASEKIPALIQQMFGVSVSHNMVENFRSRRWAPEKEHVRLKVEVSKAAIETFGGDGGFDAVLLAKLWELMDRMTIPQLLSSRSLFLKIRAQNLKEQEFLYKTGQLKFGQAAGQPVDPQEQQRGVLRRIKEIFGLATDEEAQPALAAPPPEQPALLPAAGTCNHPGTTGAAPPESGGEL